MKNSLWLISLFVVFSCKTTKPSNVAAFGGPFETAAFADAHCKIPAQIDPISKEKNQTIVQSVSSTWIARTEGSRSQYIRTAGSLSDNGNKQNIIAPETTNKNIRTGTKLFIAGTAGLVLFAILAMLLTAPIVVFTYPLIWLSVATMLTGVSFGYAGWRQLRRSNSAESGVARGKIARALFWTFAAIVAFIVLAAAYVTFFDPAGGE